MLMRLRLMLISLGAGTVLLTLLCLGAQNLKDRHSIRIGAAESVPLPTGFLVGVSLVIGVISGGSAAAVMLPEQRWD
tara:strand:+ start:237 stop:467 length:231 start_codon:yes stop_codon:yes gene_type:complete